MSAIAPAAGSGSATDTTARLASNRRQFDHLVELAERASSRGRHEVASVLCQLAAHFAWQNHCGSHYDYRLESVVASAAPSATFAARRRPAHGNRRKVLHVLTEAYNIGGHTRLAWRWMARDNASSSAVITQYDQAAPQPLTEAVRRSGGRVYHLAHASNSLLGRAMVLRRLATQFDVVVLHVHPFDVIPALAFGCEGLPPVIFENHADHCFWTGLSAANVISDHRDIAQRVSAERRAVTRSHLGFLPLPIDRLPNGPSRDAARSDLGLSDSDVLAVSVASGFKSQPLRGPGLAEALAPLADIAPRLAAIAVGPQPDERWSRCQTASRGRFQAVGQVIDPSNLLRAADIYVDSTPVGSGTSILEAASAGLPPVSLFRFHGLSEIFGSNSPGLQRGHTVVSSPEDFVEAMSSLVSDEGLRRRTGEVARQSVQDLHEGAGWSRALERLYEQAADLPRIEPVPGRDHFERADDFDRLLLEYHELGGMTTPLAEIVARHSWLLTEDVARAVRPGTAELAAAVGLHSRLSQRWRDQSQRFSRPAGSGQSSRAGARDSGPESSYVIWVASASPSATAGSRLLHLAAQVAPDDILHVLEAGLAIKDLESLLATLGGLGSARCDLALGDRCEVRICELIRDSMHRFVAVVTSEEPPAAGWMDRLRAELTTSGRELAYTGVPTPESGAVALIDVEHCRRFGRMPEAGESFTNWLSRLMTDSPDYRSGSEAIGDFSATDRTGAPPCLIAPAGWSGDPGWLAATIAAVMEAPLGASGDGNSGLRLVLPLEANDNNIDGAAQAAVREASAVLLDLGFDPANLPIEIAIGDDPDALAADYPWRRLLLPAEHAPSVEWIRQEMRGSRTTRPNLVAVGSPNGGTT